MLACIGTWNRFRTGWFGTKHAYSGSDRFWTKNGRFQLSGLVLITLGHVLL